MKGFFGRVRDEYNYYTKRPWNLEQVGKFWDTVDDYDDVNEQLYTYFRRFTNSYDLAIKHAYLCGVPSFVTSSSIKHHHLTRSCFADIFPLFTHHAIADSLGSHFRSETGENYFSLFIVSNKS